MDSQILKENPEKRIIFKPTVHSFKVWADADYGGLVVYVIKRPQLIHLL
jgi:hypothetical protein